MKNPAGLPRLGELEARVMEVLWTDGGWRNPSEVREDLRDERELAYTTVMTILVRLWKKGMLDRHKDGRSFVYRPIRTREEWAAERMSELLSIAENRSEALSHFVSDMNKADLDQLRRLLGSYE